MDLPYMTLISVTVKQLTKVIFDVFGTEQQYMYNPKTDKQHAWLKYA